MDIKNKRLKVELKKSLERNKTSSQEVAIVFNYSIENLKFLFLNFEIYLSWNGTFCIAHTGFKINIKNNLLDFHYRIMQFLNFKEVMNVSKPQMI